MRNIHGPNYRLTLGELKHTGLFRADEVWTNAFRNQGYTFIDIGDPMNLGFSDFVNMEYSYTFEWSGR